MAVEDILKVIEFIKNFWYSYIGLFASLLLSLLSPFWILSIIFNGTTFVFIKNNLWSIQIISSGILCFSILVIWLFSRRFPKRHKEKIGIVIAICDSSLESKKVKAEVIDYFQRIISRTTSSDLIEIIPLKNFQAKDVINKESAFKVSNKTGGHFVIWGKLINAGEEYEFVLDYLVRHIPLQNKTMIERGFAEVLVNKKWSFEERNALTGLKLTAENIQEICLYIMGIAAHQSYDFELSKKLHLDLVEIFKQDQVKKKELAEVSSRLPVWLGDANIALALNAYYLELDTPKAIELSNEALKYLPDSDVAKLNKALYVFEVGDVAQAENLIKNLKKRNSPTADWRYSEAFLLFLRERYDLGMKSYKKAFFANTHPVVINGVIDFLSRYILKNPEKIQFNFAYAYILIKKKMNYPEALSPLENFIMLSENRPELLEMRDLAKELLRETYNVMTTPVSEQIVY